MAEIERLVRASREGDGAAKEAAARRLGDLAGSTAEKAAIPKAGGIPPLVELLRDGVMWAKEAAVRALCNLAGGNDANKVLIAEAGGIPSLVELLRDGDAAAKYQARWTLGVLAENSASNAVAIAAAVGLEAIVQLARGGRVTVDGLLVVRNAGFAAKRKAALIVAALLRACVPDELRGRTDVRDVIRGVIGRYL